MLPFTQPQFFDLFARYNGAIWPVQIVAYGVGLVALAASQNSARRGSSVALLALAASWTWTAIAYHWFYFSAINPAAFAFAMVFIAQALVLALFARRLSIQFTGKWSSSRVAAWLMIGYALAIYPVLNAWLGHDYPRAPSFGVTPCPLVIFTLGVFALSRTRLPWLLFAAPIIWSLIGGSAAIILGVPADWALPVAGMLALTSNALKPPA